LKATARLLGTWRYLKDGIGDTGLKQRKRALIMHDTIALNSAREAMGTRAAGWQCNETHSYYRKADFTLIRQDTAGIQR
jgi:hypothetical protein